MIMYTTTQNVWIGTGYGTAQGQGAIMANVVNPLLLSEAGPRAGFSRKEVTLLHVARTVSTYSCDLTLVSSGSACLISVWC